MNANVLVVAVNDKLALNVIRCLRMAGRTPHLLSFRQLVRSRQSRYCRSWTEAGADLFEPPYDRSAAQISHCCEERSIGVVLAVDVPAIQMLSAIQNSLARANFFPLPAPGALQKLNNKWSFAELLRERHLPLPETRLVQTPEQLEHIPFNFPWIVKPLELEDGIGVKKIHSIAEAQAHLCAPGFAHQLPLLVQEFIPGVDVDLSVLADHGQVVEWTIQSWLPDGALHFLDDELIVDLGRKIVEATCYHGVAHFDMRRDERDGVVKILECNPRFWATLRESMWNGTNFVGCGIRLLAGQPLAQPKINRQLTYLAPSRALATLLKGNLAVLRRLSIENWRDAWQTVSDPLTFAHQIKNRFSNPPRLSPAQNSAPPRRHG